MIFRFMFVVLMFIPVMVTDEPWKTGWGEWFRCAWTFIKGE